MTIPRRTEALLAVFLLTFGAWCLVQFHHAQEAKKRNYWMVNALVEAAEMGEDVREIHDRYTRLTVDTFENKGEAGI
jgi:hypothetical protein